MDKVDVVTLGESMAVLSSQRIGPLSLGGDLNLSICGAESNVAIGLARLGVPAAWVGRVGDDVLGRMIITVLRGQGVDVGGHVVDPAAQSGILVKETLYANHQRVTYYRDGSAGSRLSPADVVASRLPVPRILHVSGITLGIGSPARDAAVELAMRVRESGGRVSFDVNHRSRLWPDVDQAVEAYRAFCGEADIVFAGRDESDLMVGPGPVRDQAARLVELGPSTAVVKCGAEGAVGLSDGGLASVPGVAVPVVDAVGAGDAFAAGFLAASLGELPLTECLSWGNAMGAAAVSSHGDWEGLPRAEELLCLLGSPRVDVDR